MAGCGSYRFDLWDWKQAYGEYGYGKYPDVITSLQFERLVNASGPTGGKILKPSDGKEPKTVVFIKCVGSRDDTKGKKYCSRTCCMYTAKHAHQVLEKIEGGQAVVFYMDVRTPGKAYDEFYQRTVQEGAQYLRGRVSCIYQLGINWWSGEDSLLGKQVKVTLIWWFWRLPWCQVKVRIRSPNYLVCPPMVKGGSRRHILAETCGNLYRWCLSGRSCQVPRISLIQ